MAKNFDPSRMPVPPKPTFPVEIVPPSNTGFGGGAGGFGPSPEFRAMFLKFMQEAGEVLGRAAAEEIGQAKIGIEAQKPLSGSTEDDGKKKKTPPERFALQQFMKAAGMPDLSKLAATLTMPAIAGKLANFVVNAPSNADSLAESQRRFANVSPSMASAFIESDVKGQMRDLRSGETLASSNRELLRELDKFRNSAAQWGDTITEIKNVLFTGILEGLNSIVGPITSMSLGERRNPESIPWIDRLREMRLGQNMDTPEDRRAIRRRNEVPIAPGGNPNAPAGG